MSTAFAWTEPTEASDWYVVNDTVMGGVSQSSVEEHPDQGLVFSGILSLDNNGGFTSARTEALPGDFEGVSAIRMRIKGDGRRYIATVRTQSRAMRRIYYRQAFDTTAGQTMDIDLPIADFRAYAFGTRVPSAPALADVRGQIGSVGVMLADKQPGAFNLQIMQLTAVSAGGNTQTPTARPASIEALFSMAIETGVPLFNQGRADRCADVYETAILSALLLAPDRLSDSQRSRLSQAVRSSQRDASESDRAWTLRKAMDATMAGLPPSE
jgi:monofunctional biosynthetic peptidoglycan transglycosylase